MSVLDCVAMDMGEDDFLNYIFSHSFDYLFFETTTLTINHDLSMARKIKDNSNTKIILGGTHGTVFSQELLSANPAIHCIVRNEYEEVLVNLLKCARNKGDLRHVKGISFRVNDQIVETEKADLIFPLDKLPMPAREIFPSNETPNPSLYWDGFCQHRPAIQMHASRGCPYGCDFCLWNQVMFSNGKYRTFSTERILAEMEEVVRKYGAKEIYFDDDDFLINKKRTYEFCEALMKKKMPVKWSVMGDSINIDEDLVKLMARSGCVGIKFGVESGSERILKKLGKPVKLEKVRQLVQWCSKYKVKSHATFSLGLYGEDMKSVEQTLGFMKKLDVDTIQVSICTPFPGTKFHDEAKKMGFLKNEEWEKYDGKAVNIVEYPDLDLEHVEKLRQVAIKKWFLNRIMSVDWVLRQIYYFVRICRGIGLRFLWEQFYGIILEEVLIAKWKKQKMS